MIRSKFVLSKVALSLLGLKMLLSPLTASSQQPTKAERERACREQESRLKQNSNPRMAASAHALLVRCGGAGGLVIAERWAQPPEDTATLNDLVEGSARVLDERVLQATLAAAANRVHPRSARVAALRVIWAYVSSTYVRFGEPRNFSMSEQTAVRAVGYGYPGTIQGGEPFIGDVRSRVIERMKDFAGRPDEDSYMVIVFKDVMREAAMLQAKGRGGG